MSVTYASERNAASKGVPTSDALATYSTWTRPADWLTLPTVGPTDQMFAGLYAIFDNDANYVAVVATTSSGTYTVDWGDGSSPVTASSGVAVQYLYDYATVSSGTLTTRGYKQCIVTITADTGNLTSTSINQKYVPATGPALQKYNSKWLDIIVGSPYLTSMLVTPNGSAVSAHMLEQFTLVSKSASFTDFTDKFYICFGLRQVNIDADMSNVTITNAMFYNCINLEVVPYFDTSSVTSATYMFALCSNLKSVPLYNFANCTNMTQMFNNCFSITSIPPFNTSKVTNISYMFTSCYSLKTLPFFNTSNVTTISNTFNGCRSLISIPCYDFGNVTAMENSFVNCSALESLPPLNTSKAANLLNAFNGCSSLETIPLLNTSNGTSLFATFSNCTSLKEIPALDLTNATTTTSMFASCFSLQTVPELDLNKCANVTTMFQNCSALPTIGNLNTPNVTNFTSMFSGCTALESVPDFDTAKGTAMTGMFNGCTNLKSEGLPAYDTANVTNTSSMFLGCTSLVTVPTYNTSKVTGLGSMFQNCSSLTAIPAIDMANVTTAAASFTTNDFSCGKFDATGIKYTIVLNNCAFNQVELEDIMGNKLGTGTAGAAVTISGNPGTDTAVSKTGTWTTASKNVTITASGSVTAGMYLYSTVAIANISCSFNASTDTVTVTGGPATAPIADTVMSFSTIVTTTGITVYNLYYVVNPSGATFQVSLTPGGSPINLVNTGTGTMRYALKVTNVVGTTVTLDNYPMAAGTSSAITFRNLNTNLASLRNWTIVG